ncbi:hypothetical protein N7468_004739 [Penicillium chermesinum]|uniref:Uncharacterized protein n=1 Tax=Penicillium chermesinum TaxID=63820 RepID=A0A9W9P9C4_9EURO|nr:uncharacterized protein N7468_004739 [Penicillium chermesinum]KAJ5240120.1 hypothetical protein N7468_004739 [Penicillium chermesinum]
MTDSAQMIRRFSIRIYPSRISLPEKLQLALRIKMEMDRWLAGLPERIRPNIGVRGSPRSAPKETRNGRGGNGSSWESLCPSRLLPATLQRANGLQRAGSYNEKMLLLRPLLSHFTRTFRQPP